MSAFELTSRYLCGLDEDGGAEEFEARLFQEVDLAQAAAWLLELRTALRELSAAGPIVPVVTPDQLASLATRYRVREFTPVGQTIAAAVGEDVDFVVARLPIGLEGARSIDVELCNPSGVPFFRVHQAPYDPARSEVIVLCQRHVAVAAANVRLVVRDERGIGRGEFTLLTSDAQQGAP